MDAVVRRCAGGWRYACLAAVVFCAVPSAHAGDDSGQYRRWRPANTYTCERLAPDTVAVRLQEQPVEFNNLPVDALYTSTSVKNGIVHGGARFPVEQTSGGIVYGGFQDTLDAYPLRYDFRLETIIDGAVVYRSTYTMECDGDTTSPLPVVAEQTDFGPPADRWLRWTWPKGYACTSTPDGVELSIGNQDVEFSGLPVHATFYLTTIRNGEAERTGPFSIEQVSGELGQGSIVELFDAYPVQLEQRIETVINGIVAYTSTLVAGCASGDEGAGLTADITSNGNFDLFLSGFEAQPADD